VNTRSTLLFLVLVVLATGCTPAEHRRDHPLAENMDTQAVNAVLINSFTDSAINEAIISQHTLYPYQFETGGATLNELGRRDLKVLAAHFKDNPGQLNVRRGDAAQALYDARVNAVTSALAEGGVVKGRVSIVNSLPGGEGAYADRVLKILEREDKAASAPRSYTGMTGTGASLFGSSGTGVAP
jgi:hypothetical protein